MAVQPTDVQDLMTFTLSHYKRGQFTDLMSPYQKTTAFKRILKKHKSDDAEDGVTITFNLLTQTNGSFRFVGLAPTVTLTPPGGALQGTIPTRGWTWNWWVDKQEPQMNSGMAQLLSLMKTRYFQGAGDMITGVERALWRVPAASDNTTMYGIPYYVVKSATAATYANNDGFNGTVPSGYTTVANINPTTYPRWSNYADAYTVVSKDDLVRKMRRMCEKTDFMPLVDGEPVYAVGDDYGMYMNYNTYGALVELAESQNDDLGEDVASMDGGRVMFRRTKLDWLPVLEDDTTNPFYSINWKTMRFARLKGWWEKEIYVPLNPQQPTVEAYHHFTRGNLCCWDRRQNGVISNGTTMPT